MNEPAWDDLMASLGLTPSTPRRPRRTTCDCPGDRSAYLKHLYRGEDACPKSRAANTAYLRKRKASRCGRPST